MIIEDLNSRVLDLHRYAYPSEIEEIDFPKVFHADYLLVRMLGTQEHFYIVEIGEIAPLICHGWLA